MVNALLKKIFISILYAAKTSPNLNDMWKSSTVLIFSLLSGANVLTFSYWLFFFGEFSGIFPNSGLKYGIELFIISSAIVSVFAIIKASKQNWYIELLVNKKAPISKKYASLYIIISMVSNSASVVLLGLVLSK